MKKLIAITIIIFTLFMMYVFVGGFLQNQNNEAQSTDTQTSTTTPSTQPTNSNKATANAQYTIDEIATHDTPNDCWLLIDGSVYSVSSYLEKHPGGASIISGYCGKEASKAFETQDKGSRGGHSMNARNLLAEYKIGTLKN